MGQKTKQKIYKIPVLGYLIHLVEAFFRLPRNDTRLKELRSSMGLAGQDQHLPALLNALETVPALSHQIARTQNQAQATHERQDKQSSEIAKLWERLEFIRMEIMLEMKHGQGAKDGPDAPREVVSEVLDTEKAAEQMKDLGGVRLNIGCGHVPLEGYLNTDMRPLPGVDVVADVADLPFEPGSVQEIFSSHVLEHFPQDRLVRGLLPYWFGMLREGGVFRAIAPDGAAMIDAAAAGTYDYEDFRTVLFGAQEYEGDFHFNLLTPDGLSDLLKDAGFVEVDVIETGRRNGRCFEFEIAAKKPQAA